MQPCWWDIKTQAHPWHCRDSSEAKSQHLSPAVSPLSLSPALGPGIQVVVINVKCIRDAVISVLCIMDAVMCGVSGML